MYDLKKTDPEFAERFEHFAFDEVINEDGRCAALPYLLRCSAAAAWTHTPRFSRRRLRAA